MPLAKALRRICYSRTALLQVQSWGLATRWSVGKNHATTENRETPVSRNFVQNLNVSFGQDWSFRGFRESRYRAFECKDASASNGATASASAEAFYRHLVVALL